MKKILFLLLITISYIAQAQVEWTTFDNDFNPLVFTADGVDSVYIPVFTAQKGCDGLIVVSAGYTQSTDTDNGITSIQFSSIFLTKGVSVKQMVGGVYEVSEIWYAPIGTRIGINSFVDVRFANISNSIVINVTSYHNVDQLNPIGSVDTNVGVGTSSSINLSTSDQNGVIDNLYSGGSGAITAGATQNEISNALSGNTNGNSFQLAAGSTTSMSWTKSNSTYTHVAMELNLSYDTTIDDGVEWTTLNNDVNPLTITGDAVDSIYMNVFTAGPGCGGLIVVSIGYTQPIDTSGITSILFSSTFLKKGVSASQLVGNTYAHSEIWYAEISPEVGVNSFVNIQFANTSNSVVATAFSFHHVDHENPIGETSSNVGIGTSSSINFNLKNHNAWIDNLYSGGSDPITVGIGQSEISNESSGNTNGNSFKLISCNGNLMPMSWTKPNTTYTHVAMELNYSSCAVPVEFIEFEEAEIQIFPNPTSGDLTINTALFQDAEISVFNHVGQRLKTIQWQGGSINLSSFPSGLYILVFENQGKVFRKQVIKK